MRTSQIATSDSGARPTSSGAATAADEPVERTRDHGDLGEPARVVLGSMTGMSSCHNIVKYGSAILSTAGRFSQIWNSSSGFGLVRLEQREHLGVDDALPRGEPLHVAARRSAPVAPSESEWSIWPRRTKVTVSKPRCGCWGNPGHDLAVVHVPAVDPVEVRAHLAAGEARAPGRGRRCRRGTRRRDARRTGRGRSSATAGRAPPSGARNSPCPRVEPPVKSAPPPPTPSDLVRRDVCAVDTHHAEGRAQ